jgi:hypothetical protein
MSRVATAVISLLGLAACATIAVLASCVSDVGVTQYGDPGALRRDNLPGEGGTEAVVCDGGVPETGPCPVSFGKDIYPNMTANGIWKCASGGKCHGAQQAPTIDASTPQAVIDSLKAYQISGNQHPYINEGSRDPTQSTFECNMTGECGSGMPLDPGVPLTPAEVCKIDAWLRCGAPSN